LLLCLFIILLIPASGFSYLHDKGSNDTEIQVPSRIVVKVKSVENGTPGNQLVDLNSIRGKRELDKKYGVQDTKLLFPEKSAREYKSPLSGIYIVECSRGVDLKSAASEYARLENVEYAHPDYVLELYEAPNDELFGVQWPLNNTGQGYPHVLRRDGSYNDTLITMYGTSGSDIDALEVFENPPDNTSTVIIAVIDTGVDMEHPELAGRIWQNSGEIPANGIDDDHNGYVDDIRGWDYTSSAGIPVTPDNDPSDTYGHGTHCAGIIASLTNNVEGIAGIVPDCKIMPLKFYPVMLSSYAVQAIVYAADNGADVITMSWGYPWQIQMLEDALQYARSKGVVLCAATGNDGVANNNYPGSSPNVISVGASTSDDEVAFFSTYGEQMDVIAPGYSVLSLRAAGTDMYGQHQEPNVHIIDENYYVASGTSMACPHAAAVATFMRAVSPGLKPEKVQEIMQNTAKDILDPYGDGQDLPGWDQYSGYGRINVRDALAAVPSVRAMITSPANNGIISDDITISGIADGDDFMDYILEYGQGAAPSAWTTISNSTTPVTDDVLGIFNTSGLNGIYTIRLSVGEDNSDQVTLCIAHDNVALISSPIESDTVISQASIHGSAICPDFSRYTLEYRSTSNPGWTQFVSSTIPVADGYLGDWQASSLAMGDYYIRLNTYSQSGIMARDTVEVYLRHILSQEGNWKISIAPQMANVINFGDLDNDHINEIIVGTDTGIKFFTTQGTEKTAGMPQIPAYDFRMPPAVGDLDGDGLDDLVAVGVDGSVARLMGYLSGGSSFETELPAAPRLDDYSNDQASVYPAVFLKDTDADGLDEILYALRQHCWVFSSTGELLSQIPYTGEILRCQYLSNDCDGDGIDELYSAFQFLCQSDLNGNLVDSFDLRMGAANECMCDGLSAVDIDGDGKRELIAYTAMLDTVSSYWIYAFDEGLVLKDGWPRDIGIDAYLIPPIPIFGDFDLDGKLDYFTAFYELTQAMVYGWRISGSTYIPDAGTPLFAGPDYPGRMVTCIMANIDGDNAPEIIGEVKRDVFMTYDVQRLMAWDYLGNALNGWPIVLRQSGEHVVNFGANTPSVGDISGDGHVDMVFASSKNELVFLTFDVMYQPNNCPVPFWRYNRRFNNISNASVELSCGDVNGSGSINVSDAVYLINYIFVEGPPPVQYMIGDANCDGDTNISDVVVIINYVFLDGHAPCDLDNDGIPDCWD
jgi:subtilisin family serine protease